MVSDLPVPVARAAEMLRDPQVWNDPASRQKVIDWGLAEIADEYPQSPFRPGNAWRRLQAEKEWRRVVQEAGKQLRAGAMRIRVEGRLYTLQRELDDLRYQDAERRRRNSVSFDTDERIREADALAGIHARHLPPPPPTPEDPIALTKRFQREIAEIAADRSLSQDEKHRLTRLYRDALQAALQGAGKQGRG